MQKFILQIVVFALLLALAFGWVLAQADGRTDDHYLKFTTPQQPNLIVGTSRAAQGMHPAVFEEVLGLPFYNYAFTIDHSPYGPVYFESIKKKVGDKTTDGEFIVTVGPWSISSLTKDPDDVTRFRENRLSVARVPYVNLYPNIFYLHQHYRKDYYHLLLQKRGRQFLHDDGWLQIDIDMSPRAVKGRLGDKLRRYGNTKVKEFKFSPLRLEYLKKTIEWLNAHGDVYLVRLPINLQLLAIDNELIPSFDSLMRELEPQTAGYLDMTPMGDEFIYIDGNHLEQHSGKDVSRVAAEWIKQRMEQGNPTNQ